MAFAWTDGKFDWRDVATVLFPPLGVYENKYNPLLPVAITANTKTQNGSQANNQNINPNQQLYDAAYNQSPKGAIDATSGLLQKALPILLVGGAIYFGSKLMK